MSAFKMTTSSNKIIKEYEKLRDEFEKSEYGEVAYLNRIKNKVDDVCGCINCGGNLDKYWQSFINDKEDEDGDNSVKNICDDAISDVSEYLSDKYEMTDYEITCLVRVLTDIGRCEQSYYNCADLLRKNLKTRDPKTIMSMCESAALVDENLRDVQNNFSYYFPEYTKCLNEGYNNN